VLNAVPLGVDVVAGRVQVLGALVLHDLFHELAFEEVVLGVQQRSAEQCHVGGMPAGLPFELFHVALCAGLITVGSKADRDQGGRQTFKVPAVLADKVGHKALVLAHVDGRRHNDAVLSVRNGVRGMLEVRGDGLVAVRPDHIGDVLRNVGCLPFNAAVSNVDSSHAPLFLPGAVEQ
jgi:hypothetical protein